MINRDMKLFKLQKRVQVDTFSGAKKYDWQDYNNIEVALYTKDDFKNTQSTEYNESSHVGITRFKDINKHENRLVKDNVVYIINKVTLKGRNTVLLLKVVDTDV